MIELYDEEPLSMRLSKKDILTKMFVFHGDSFVDDAGVKLTDITSTQEENMKIVKISKLPKLKVVKYKCKYCGSIFLVPDEEILNIRRTQGTSYFKCPACNDITQPQDKQLKRIRKYEHVSNAQAKWFKGDK